MAGPYLIFDFDGVIGDTLSVTTAATAHVDGISLDAAAASNLKYASEKPNHTRDHSLSQQQLQAIYKWTSDFGQFVHESQFALFDDFVHIIEDLWTTYKAIVSSGSQRYVLPALADTKINPTHILAYENHHSKEEKIETICADWGVTPADVYYFTDTLADVYELQTIITKEHLIGVSWGFCGYDLLARELEDAFILKKPQDIHSVL